MLIASTARSRLGPIAAIALLWLGLIGGAPGCDSNDQATVPDLPIDVVVSIAPLAWAFEGLPAEVVRVRVIVPPSSSPHGFELTNADRAAIARADIVALVGLGVDAAVEEAVGRTSPAGRRVVRFNDAAGVASGEPHLWLDPTLMLAFLDASSDAMIGAIEARQAVGLDVGEAAALQAELHAARLAVCYEIDDAYATTLAALDGSVVTVHNAFGRVADRYGLRIAGVFQPVEGVETTADQLDAIVKAVETQDVRAIYLEPQLRSDLATKVAERAGVRLLTVDPIGDAAPFESGGGWPAMMRANLDAFVEGLRGDAGE